MALPGAWLCVFSVGDFEGPFAPKNFETTEEMDEVLLLASQVLDGLEPEADRSELEAVISDEFAIDKLLLQTSQPFERSTGESEKPVKRLLSLDFWLQLPWKMLKALMYRVFQEKPEHKRPGLLEYGLIWLKGA